MSTQRTKPKRYVTRRLVLSLALIPSPFCSVAQDTILTCRRYRLATTPYLKFFKRFSHEISEYVVLALLAPAPLFVEAMAWLSV